MTRKEEIMAEVNNDKTMEPLINDMVYLENQLDQLRVLPKILVNPNDPQLQMATPAAKLYKEYLQQYVNVVKVVIKSTGRDQVDDESPLRRWAREHGS